MRREAPRTLLSLSTRYQRGVSVGDYEVHVVENGSSEPLDEALVKSFGTNFRYTNLGPQALPSPCRAINQAVVACTSPQVGILIDGARIASPGLIASAMKALRLGRDPVVATLAWHLGDEPQYVSVARGYCQAVEDRLLDGAAWIEDGYNLFNISALAWSSEGGYFAPLNESNAIFMSRARFLDNEGFDERFDLPGGGYANPDFFKRVCEYGAPELVILLGEGTFHQVHGGVAANAPDPQYVRAALRQYENLHGFTYSPPAMCPTYLGQVAPQALRWIKHSA